MTGGGGSYSGEISTSLRSGGENRAAFGAINFGDNASVGGTSTAEGTGTSTILYVLAALAALYFLLKR
jgi:hypothetical protein